MDIQIYNNNWSVNSLMGEKLWTYLFGKRDKSELFTLAGHFFAYIIVVSQHYSLGAIYLYFHLYSWCMISSQILYQQDPFHGNGCKDLACIAIIQNVPLENTYIS